MLQTTKDIIRSALKADPTVSARERNEFLTFLNSGPPTPNATPVPNQGSRIISRSKACQKLDRSLRFVDRLAEQGLLQKVTLPGRKRAVGFLEADVEALISGHLPADGRKSYGEPSKINQQAVTQIPRL